MRRAFLMGLSSLVLALAGCGGGSDTPDGDLAVTFEYPASTQVSLFDDVNVSPKLDGFSGRAPKFAVEGTLPHGFTLSNSNGTVGGYAGIAGTHYVDVVVSVDGYEGSLTEAAVINVTSDISITYASTASTSFRLNSAAEPVMPTVTGLRAGDTVSNFRASVRTGAAPSQLPPGMALNAQTGAFSGTLTMAGIYVVWVDATVTRGTKTATVPVQSYVYFNVQ